MNPLNDSDLFSVALPDGSLFLSLLLIGKVASSLVDKLPDFFGVW